MALPAPFSRSVRSSGRTPIVTADPRRALSPAGARAAWNAAAPGRLTAPSAATVAARKFIGGLPMKPATNWFAGRW